MKYTQLGATSLRVSRLCMGTVFRREPDEQTCINAIHTAADLGCNYLDSANIYLDGHSEEIVGKAIRGQRDRFVVSTKVGSQMPGDPTTAGLKRDNIIACCEASLQRLGTDYLDTYLCHTPDPDTPIEETLEAFDRLVAQGKVRYPGVSNFESWRLCQAVMVSQQRGWPSVACNQCGYGLLNRPIEGELVSFCQEAGIGITAYATTAIGLLTGRYRYGQPPPAGSSWDRGPYNFHVAMTPAAGQVIDKVVEIAADHGKTPTQVAMAWCLRRPVVNAVIIGTDTPEMARENFADGDWELPPTNADELDRVSDGHWTIIRKDCPRGYEEAGDQQIGGDAGSTPG